MTDSEKTRQLLETYYRGFSKKEGWESVLSDDFIFVGGDMTNQNPVLGKEGYVEVIKRFSRVFSTMRVKEMILEGNKACSIVNYDFTFPNGINKNGNVAELWEVKDGKLNSLTIFFDTLTFYKNTIK